MMRILRGIGAVVVWLLATVVMVVALVASVTIVLLPLGVPLLVLGLRLYGYGVRLMIPRAPEVKRGVRKSLGLRAHGSLGWSFPAALGAKLESFAVFPSRKRVARWKCVDCNLAVCLR